VKRLYGLTNKRTATKQIGARYRRMEAAQLAQRKSLKWNSKLPRSSHNPPDDLDMNVRYSISKSRNHPVDVWSFLGSNKSDPCLKVLSLSKDYNTALLMHVTVIYRASYRNFRTTYSVVYWSARPREIPTAISQMQNGTWFTYWAIRSSNSAP
jgi:hypothetical protein